jgi:hypothetical protein
VQPPGTGGSWPAVQEPHLLKCSPDTPSRSRAPPGEPSRPYPDDRQTDARQTGARDVTRGVGRWDGPSFPPAYAPGSHGCRWNPNGGPEAPPSEPKVGRSRTHKHKVVAVSSWQPNDLAMSCRGWRRQPQPFRKHIAAAAAPRQLHCLVRVPAVSTIPRSPPEPAEAGLQSRSPTYSDARLTHPRGAWRLWESRADVPQMTAKPTRGKPEAGTSQGA